MYFWKAQYNTAAINVIAQYDLLSHNLLTSGQ